MTRVFQASSRPLRDRRSRPCPRARRRRRPPLPWRKRYRAATGRWRARAAAARKEPSSARPGLHLELERPPGLAHGLGRPLGGEPSARRLHPRRAPRSRSELTSAPSAPAATTTRSRYQLERMSSASRISSRSAPRPARRTRCSSSRGDSSPVAAASASERASAPRACASSPTLVDAPAGSNAGSRYTERASSISAALRSPASSSSSRSARSSRTAREPRERVELLTAHPAGREVRLHRPLREPLERDVLAARADRRRERAEIVGDEDDDRVVGRLLEILEERVRGVLVHRVRGENEVDAPRGLEWPHVQVAPELPDRVDADLVAERLEDVEVRVRPPRDAVRVAKQRAREGERGPALADSAGSVKEVGMRRPLGERRSQEALGLVLLREGLEGVHGFPRRGPSGFAVPSSGDDTLREDLGDLAVGAVDQRRELVALALDPVRRLAPALRRHLARDDQQKGPVGEQAARHGEVDLEHPLDPKAAREALVGERGVEVAVADDIGSAAERRADHLVDELRTRRAEERGLGPRREPVAPQEKLADALSDLRSTWLAGVDDLAPVRPKAVGQEPRLCTFPRAVDAFEGDEHGSAPRIVRRAGAGNRRSGLHRLACRGRARRARRRRLACSTTSRAGSPRTSGRALSSSRRTSVTPPRSTARSPKRDPRSASTSRRRRTCASRSRSRPSTPRSTSSGR